MRQRHIGAVIIGTIGAIGMIGSAAASSPPGEPIELPETLGDLTALDVPQAYPDTTDATTVEERIARWQAADEFNADGFSDALGGVPAAARTYGTEDLALLYNVVALRTVLPPLLPLQFVDPTALGLEKPITEFVWVDDVSCLVSWVPVPAGEEVTDDDRQSVVCQATGDDVTVRITANSGETPEHLAELANEVVAAIA